MVTERGVADHRRGHRGEHDRTEGLDGEVAQDELEGEEHPGDRRIERRRDPSGSPTGDEQAQPALGDPEELAGGGAEGRADLDDRALPADRAAGADAQRRGDRLHRGDGRLDAPAALGDRQHYLRHPVAAGLLREAIDNRSVDEPPDHRYQHNEEHAEPGEVWTRDATGV